MPQRSVQHHLCNCVQAKEALLSSDVLSRQHKQRRISFSSPSCKNYAKAQLKSTAVLGS